MEEGFFVYAGIWICLFELWGAAGLAAGLALLRRPRTCLEDGGTCSLYMGRFTMPSMALVLDLFVLRVCWRRPFLPPILGRPGRWLCA